MSLAPIVLLALQLVDAASTAALPRRGAFGVLLRISDSSVVP